MDDELDRAAKKHRLQQRSGALRARLAQNRGVSLKVLAWIRDTLPNHDILNFHGFTTFKTKFLIFINSTHTCKIVVLVISDSEILHQTVGLDGLLLVSCKSFGQK